MRSHVAPPLTRWLWSLALLAPVLIRCSAAETGAPQDGPQVSGPSTPPTNTDATAPAVATGTTPAPDVPTDPNAQPVPDGSQPATVPLPTNTPTGATPAVQVPPADGGGMTTIPPAPAIPALDCGPDGFAYETSGPVDNRVNYVILADGYTAETVLTTLDEHINVALDRRFNHESGEPYGRYRKFVNVCVERVVSASDGIGNGPTAFSGGNGGDRLARVDQNAVNAYLDANIPDTLEIDWRAVVLNQDLWENTGSTLMLWSGGNRDAAGAALHEGGHGFHQLADEYCGSSVGTSCGPEGGTGAGTEFSEVNSTGDPAGTAGKWDLWLGMTQMGIRNPTLEATGVQSVFVGSRYVDTGQYRPSGNSMMNSLFCRAGVCTESAGDLTTSFNAVSREQMIFSIWRAVRPVDSTDPPAGQVDNPATLTVNVIDPAVINVDWAIDGEVVALNGGGLMNLASAGLASGDHVITATAYDNAGEDLVRLRTGVCPDSVTRQFCHATGWLNSMQTVEWTVTIP